MRAYGLLGGISGVFMGVALSSPAQADEPARYMVESHDVLLMDISSSMDEADIEASFTGVANHYLSEDARKNYAAGICTANTVIYFADRPSDAVTWILCSEKSVSEFLSANILNFDIAAMRHKIGSGTSVEPPLKQAAVVFSAAKEGLLLTPDGSYIGVDSGRRRVALAGDELGGDTTVLRQASDVLSYGHGATVYAVAIENAQLAASFESAITTPSGVTYDVKMRNDRTMTLNLAKGEAMYAANSTEAGKMFQAILSLSGY